jgi:hypothetical protein
MRSDTPVSDTAALERNAMRRDRIHSWTVNSFRRTAGGFRIARLVRYAAAGLVIVIAASSSPQAAHAQEYPWCLAREGYLYCFYKTQEQCQWTASGIGGCALNPRLLFPIKPRDS